VGEPGGHAALGPDRGRSPPLQVTVAGERLRLPAHLRVGGDAVDWTAASASLDVRVDETLALGERQRVEFGAQLTASASGPGRPDAAAAKAARARARIEPRAISGGVYVDHERDSGPRVSVRYGARLSPSQRARSGDGLPLRRRASGRLRHASLGRFEPRRCSTARASARGATSPGSPALEPRASVRLALGARREPQGELRAHGAVPPPRLAHQRAHAARRVGAVGRYLRPQRADQLAVGYATVGAVVPGAVRRDVRQRLVDVVDFRRRRGPPAEPTPRGRRSSRGGGARPAGAACAPSVHGRTTGW
jgi:hypothetical protein